MDTAVAFQTAQAKASEVQEEIRKAYEQGIEQSRAAYTRLKLSAEEATSNFEASYTVATAGLRDFNATAINALQANMLAGFDLIKAMTGVKTVPEAMTIQSEHARKQYEAVTAQTQKLADLVQKSVAEAAAPIKAQFSKSFAH